MIVRNRHFIPRTKTTHRTSPTPWTRTANVHGPVRRHPTISTKCSHLIIHRSRVRYPPATTTGPTSGPTTTGPTQPYLAEFTRLHTETRVRNLGSDHGILEDFEVRYGDVAALLSTLVGRAHDSQDDGRTFEGVISITDQVFAVLAEDLITTNESAASPEALARLHLTAHLSVWDSIQTLM